MESDILSFIAAIPWWVYLLGFIVYIIKTGKMVEWEYEAKLISQDGADVVGEVEIKKYTKEPPMGEIEIRRGVSIDHGVIEVRVNDALVSKIETTAQGTQQLFPHLRESDSKFMKSMQRMQKKSMRKRYFFVEAHVQPQNSDVVEITFPDGGVLKGTFYKD